MFDQLKKDIKIHGDTSLGFLLFLPFAFLIGTGMFYLIMTIEGEQTWFCMGTLMSLIMLVGCVFFLGFSYYQEMMLALSMGRTRKAFLCSYALRRIGWYATACLLILGFYYLEQTLYSLWFLGSKNRVEFTFLTDWRLILGIILGGTLINMFVGIMYSRFGKKFWMILYLGFMGCCIILPKAIPDEDHTGIIAEFASKIVGWAVSIDILFWAVLGVCAVVAMIVTIIHLGRKEMVH